jgi:hypothetical protein
MERENGEKKLVKKHGFIIRSSSQKAKRMPKSGKC